VPNVLDIDPVRRLAKRVSARIGDPTIASRYEKLAKSRILGNPRNLRPASDAELNRAPAWTRDAIVRGETICVFRSDSSMAARLYTVARRLADTVRLAAMERDGKPDLNAAINEARRFLAKFGRANFDTAARKALKFSRTVASREGDLDVIDVCPAQSIVLLGGCVWHRIVSVAELRKIGREFVNCLARASSLTGHGAMLVGGRSQFWVLRDVRGAGLMIACATAPLATHFTEVKGPRNAPIPADHPALAQLGVVIGVAPTPPVPPAFGEVPAGLLSLIEHLHEAAGPAHVPRLRQRARAH
jgi:hypothetical protein